MARRSSKARDMASGPPDTDPGDAEREQAQQELVAAAVHPLSGALVTHIVETCKKNLQTIDTHTMDVLLGAGWDTSTEAAPKNTQDFESSAATTRTSSRADHLLRPAPAPPGSHLRPDPRGLRHLAGRTPRTSPRSTSGRPTPASTNCRQRRPISELTALVALIRRACGIDGKLTPSPTPSAATTATGSFAPMPDNPSTHSNRLARTHPRPIMTSLRLEAPISNTPPSTPRAASAKCTTLRPQMEDLIDELNQELMA